MVDGLPGINGVLVLELVERDIKTARDLAPTLHRAMAENHAVEGPSRRKNATHTLVTVGDTFHTFKIIMSNCMCHTTSISYLVLTLVSVHLIVDGGWSHWGKWCACSKSCGTGEQNRKRSCDNPSASNGGKPCAGVGTEFRKCNTAPCQSTYVFKAHTR